MDHSLSSLSKKVFARLSRKLAQSTSSQRDEGKVLRYETLEPRAMLSASDVVDFVAQPAGQLDGKIVFAGAGHGWQWSSALNRWATDRGDNNEIVEDFGNQDQITYYADYLLRAGATVVPLRPVGNQLNEVVLDNDSPGVTYSGAWSNSTFSVYYDEDYGSSTDSVSYRFSSINASETAVATYTPNIPEAGFYPVYTWVLDSSNRTDQLYRINSSDGGVTEIRVDHRKVGKGWVYLGTYHFDAGTSGNVEISNQSTAGGSVVIADAIRFGNGMGDMLDGNSGVGHPSGVISGQPREDENTLMWTWRAIGEGTSPSSVVGTGNVSAPHLMAEHMNNNSNAFGDSVYIGFHSNAGGGRGADGLFTNSPALRTPNQVALAQYVSAQINDDMFALNGQFEHNWSQSGASTVSFINFGEIDGGPGAEMDMTIIETGFHDDVQDAQLMRDPKVRDQMARSTYEATLQYFDNHGGLSTPVSQPSVPVDVAAVAESDGDITVSWSPGVIGVQGGTPTAFRVYVSDNGYSYAGYVEVAGGGAGSYTFDAADLDDSMLYFKVVGVNSGGESPGSSVVAAQKAANGKSLLIVDGYDRNSRSQNERYAYAFTGDGLVDRVRTRYNNSFDYAARIGAAIEAYSNEMAVSTAVNEQIISGDINLDDYDAVIWFSGEESSVDDTFNSTEQGLVSSYLAGGGQIFVSGAEIGWDLEALGNGQSFYNNSLKADYVGDDAGTYGAQGTGGSIFAGLSFAFDDGTSGTYDVNFPDRLSPLGGATTALTYVGGTGDGAAIQFDGGATKVVNFGFPFETITSAADRTAVMQRVLDFFELDANPTADFDQDGWVTGLDFLAWQRGAGTSSGATLADGDADADGDVDGDDLGVWDATYGQAATVAALVSEPLEELSASAQGVFEIQSPGFQEDIESGSLRDSDLLDAGLAWERLNYLEPAPQEITLKEEAWEEFFFDSVETTEFAPSSSDENSVDYSLDEAPETRSESAWLADEVLEKVFG